MAVPLTAWQLWKVAHGNGYSATEQTVQANAAAISEETGADHEQVIRSWAIAAPLLALLLPSLAIMNAVASLSARAARHGFAVRRQRQAAGVAVLAAGVAVPPLLYGWLALSAVALCLGMPRLWLLLRHGSPQRLSPGRRRLAVIAVSDCVLMPWEIAARGIQLLAQGRYWTSGKG